MSGSSGNKRQQIEGKKQAEVDGTLSVELRELMESRKYAKEGEPTRAVLLEVLRSSRFFATMVVSSLAKDGRNPSAGERW